MNVAKILIYPALFLSLILSATGCQEEIPQTVTSVMFDETSVTMIKGSTHQLTVVVLPEGIETELEWTSTDTSVAKVSADGLVSAAEEGRCRIWVRSGAFMAVCDVTVLKVPAESIILNESSIEIMPGEQFQLSATINMMEVRSEDILRWTSSDMNVAVVDSAGMVTAMRTGEATVTAMFMGVTAECKVSVSDIPASEIRLTPDRLSMFVGETATIEAAVLPINASYKEITWASSDAAIVSVSDDGEIEALAAGEATITAECDGITAECAVSIQMPAAKVGDYYYSDGTWSSEFNENKDVIGVVFWVGDPTFDDNALKSEHPDCTHGLVVSLDETQAAWQGKWSEVEISVNNWIIANTDYEPIATGSNMGDPMNKIVGYNNSSAIEAYHTDPSNSAWPVQAIQAVIDHREQYPAPASSSDWYLPGTKELSLLITGIFDNNIYNIGNNTANRPVINETLSTIPGAVLISETSQYYHSSSENTWDYVWMIDSSIGMLMNYDKGTQATVRAVLAF